VLDRCRRGASWPRRLFPLWPNDASVLRS